MSSEYVIALRRALAHEDVLTTTTRDRLAEDCVWCQVIGARSEIAIYWTPRWDVISDGNAECCLDCAPERIRRAIDDSPAGERVRVEVAEVVHA